jgi:hypothetical protein
MASGGHRRLRAAQFARAQTSAKRALAKYASAAPAPALAASGFAAVGVGVAGFVEPFGVFAETLVVQGARVSSSNNPDCKHALDFGGG